MNLLQNLGEEQPSNLLVLATGTLKLGPLTWRFRFQGLGFGF